MGWTLVKEGDVNGVFAGYREFQLDSESDINSPSPEAQSAAPTSKAWTGDYQHIYNKKNDGTWFDILKEE